MLIGQYENKLSEKHQVALPKKFREILGEELIVTKGFESCLIVVSKDSWKTLLEGTEGRPFTSKNTRELQRFLLGNATDIGLDGKGRFVIPSYLREFAKLGSDVIFVGIERFVEIWDKKAWDVHQAELSGNIESIAEKLSGDNE